VIGAAQAGADVYYRRHPNQENEQRLAVAIKRTRLAIAALSGAVAAKDEDQAAKARLEANGVEVIGPTNHTLFKSIYFFDCNGHRLELACDVGTPDMQARAAAVKWDMLEEWTRTRRAPRHSAWMHEAEFAE
jgi:lactoylglutathione lyase